jgi:membrane-associated phospholipid phosphatase
MMLKKQSYASALATCSLMLVLLFSACKPEVQTPTPPAAQVVKSFDSKVVQQWNNLFLDVERYATVYRPCPAARALGYMGWAAYESCVAGMRDYQSLANLHPALRLPSAENGATYNWPLVVNAVYATMFKKFFANVQPTDLFKIATLETSLSNQLRVGLSAEVTTRSEDYGKRVAEAVYAFSATDTVTHDKYLNPRPSNYTPPVGQGKWKVTAPGNQAAMFPYWGGGRMFALKDAEKTARPPLAYSEDKNSPYYTQMLEVYSTTAPQTSEGRWIAEFWSDDVLGFTFSPPSRWVAILNQVLSKDKINLETAVFAAAKVGLALNDASVACWHSKFYYNLERPVTYIAKNINPTWNIMTLTTNNFLGSTPPFPGYPSGHSTFGAAAAEALVSVFGSNYTLTDRCHEGRTDFEGSRPRTFESFYDMAVENAYSRIPLGVHTRQDCEEGLRLGYIVGRRVSQLPFKK